MAVISDIPDGSNDGDPNKNPQELEKKLGEEEVENQNERAEEEEVEDQNEKPEEEEEQNQIKNPEEEEEQNQIENPEEEEEEQNQIEKPEEDEKVQNQKEKHEEEVVNQRDYFGSLDPDATEVCLAYVSKYDYPTISMASTDFGRLIASSKLYIARSQLDATERFLYVLISFPSFILPRWYILYQSSLRLRRINSLPTMPFAPAVVTMGSEIYVIGGCDGERTRTSDVILIDCKTHTCDRSLPRMKVARLGPAAGIIDGKIYVIGGCEKRDSDWIEVFDLNTKTWSGLFGTIETEVHEEFMTDVVMEEKIYALERHRCHFFSPKELIWTTMAKWCQLDLYWRESSCVIDDMLYSIFPPFDDSLMVYNPKIDFWRSVDLGESQALMPPHLIYAESRMANFGGKLVILATNRSWSLYCDGENEIWCFKIALKQLQDGWIGGTVESADIVLTTKESPPSIEFCPTLTM